MILNEKDELVRGKDCPEEQGAVVLMMWTAVGESESIPPH